MLVSLERMGLLMFQEEELGLVRVELCVGVMCAGESESSEGNWTCIHQVLAVLVHLLHHGGSVCCW